MRSLSESLTDAATEAAQIDLSERDRRLLDRAVALGRRGWARVHPNPMVGCVVARGEEIVGEGWHAEFGGPHAEVAALREAGDRARGAEVFVSLEPCRHEGKTPACSRALLQAGVSRVVFGARDPGELSGGGAIELEAQGVEVVGPGLSARQARWENPFFFHRRVDRPWVALKLAMSLDARIAAREGERTILTAEEEMAEVHRLRAGFDAVLVGTKTALVDDPLLTVRGAVEPRVPPRRIVLDAKGRMDVGAKLFAVPRQEGEVWVVTTLASPLAWKAAVRDKGARVIEVEVNTEGRMAVGPMLARLRGDGVASLLCEGGGAIGAELLRHEMVDRLYVAIAPVILGAEGVPAFPLNEEAWTKPWAKWRPGEPPRFMGPDVWMALEPRDA